ncbi:MAG: NAD(P)/FAD-dependent oxidoreductase, partial [Chloroflexi bacterium]|nr:NAD(P)/FAD-dependent oxidoreductase [Chloroflexota bacterium]
MKIETVELLVVGAGPAGLGAAVAAAEQGVETVVVDGFSQPGGQYFMQMPAAFFSVKGTDMEEKGKLWLDKLENLPVRVISKTLVWGIFEEEGRDTWMAALYGVDSPRYFRARKIILANGAYDSPVPFPGWTLPGVMTCGAALILLKTYRVAPGTKALVTGAGPLLLSVAAHLIGAGAQVAAVCESNRPFPRGLAHLPAILENFSRVREGVRYAGRLMSAGTPYKPGWSVLSASGRERVERAVIVKLDKTGRPIPAVTQTFDVDLVVTGYSLIPNTGLARMIGCELDYQPQKGGWIPLRDENMRASKPGVYVVGDGAGIGGAENALLEGQIAGVHAAQELGHLAPISADEALRSLRAKRRSQIRFGQMYGDLFTPQHGLISLARDDTILCRCEDVTLGQVKEAIQMGATTLREVKMATRCGMGNCQGRMCERSV